MSDARAAFADRLVTCCTIVGFCMFAIGAGAIVCLALDWTLDRAIKTFRLYSAFFEFVWERRKTQRKETHDDE